MILITVVLVTIIIALKWRWSVRRQVALAKKMKTNIRTWPILGHAYKAIGTNEDRMKIFHEFGRDAIACGGISKILCLTRILVCVADPVVAELLLKECLEKHEFMKMINHVLGDASIIAPVSTWRLRRRMNISVFNTKNIQRYVQPFFEHSIALTKTLEQRANKGTFCLLEYTRVTTMNTVCETTMGLKLTFQGIDFLKAVQELWDIASSLLCQPWSHFDFIFKRLPIYKTILKHKLTVYNFITQVIQGKQKIINDDSVQKIISSENRPLSFLDRHLAMDDKDLRFSELELVEESLLLIGAGFDTTAISSAVVATILSRHEDIQDKVYKELTDVFGDSDRAPTYEDLFQLNYLEAVIKETLRLYPVVPILVRNVDKDVTLPSGLTIVKDCGVLVNVWALHRNPHYWGEDAEQFRPERFLPYTPTHPAQYMPFSYGPRNCIGNRYAMVMLKCLLSTLLRRYRVLAPPGAAQGEPLRTKFEIMSVPVDHCEIRLEHRR